MKMLCCHGIRKIAGALLLAGVLYAAPAMACTTCFGTPDSAQAQGMNAAIFTLLGITGSVLSIAGVVGGAVLWRMRGVG